MPTDRKAGGDFGGRLRDARERKGVSLRQIAESTRISVGILEALERNEISRLPGGIFSRAFVRAYALEVGLDPEATVDHFLRQFPQESVAAGHSAAARMEEIDTFESDRRMAMVVVRLGLVSILIAGALLYFGTSGRLTNGDRAPATPSTPEQPAAVSTADLETKTAAQDGRLVVEVVARRAVTVSTAQDGGPEAAVALAAG